MEASSCCRTIKKAQVYFTHPYAPWKRYSDENQNGLIREFMPKGMSMNSFDESYITNVQYALNHGLRKPLGYHSTSEVFQRLSPTNYANA